MTIELDPSCFRPLNVTDACGVWNILSSKILYNTATSVPAKCVFSCTGFVHYECLIKPRNNKTDEEMELRRRLTCEIKKGQFKSYHLEIEDLQEIEILEQRKKLGKGELSSIAFAKRTRQAFLTDDDKARKLAEKVMERKSVQTTPHLLGWLFYRNLLSDSEKEAIINEHNKFRIKKWGNLEKHFEVMYERSLKYRLMSRTI